MFELEREPPLPTTFMALIIRLFHAESISAVNFDPNALENKMIMIFIKF